MLSPEGGLAALFAASFLAATVVPLSSEAVLFGYLKLHPQQLAAALTLATAGNTLGGLTSYALGRLVPERTQHKLDPRLAMENDDSTLVHLADDWLVADDLAAGSPPTLKITKVVGPTRDFPGRTTALVQVLHWLKNGGQRAPGRTPISPAAIKRLGNPIVDLFEHSCFGSSADLGAFPFKATFLAAADASGDKKADLVAIGADGVHFLLGAGSGQPFKDATAAWGLAGASGSKAAFGDASGDGRPDLLLDQLWVNAGTKFAPSKSGINLTGKDVLAVALADVTGDGKADAVALLRSGELLVFKNPGSTDQPWPAEPPRRLWTGGEAPLAAHFDSTLGDNGKLNVIVIRMSDITRYALHDDGGPPMGFARLTGQVPSAAVGGKGVRATYIPMKAFQASSLLDINGGDGRADLCVATGLGKSNDIVMLNRGYGMFWVNNEGQVSAGGGGGKGRGKGGGGGGAIVAMTAADMNGDGSQSLLILTAGGNLTERSPFKTGQP